MRKGNEMPAITGTKFSIAARHTLGMDAGIRTFARIISLFNDILFISALLLLLGNVSGLALVYVVLS